MAAKMLHLASRPALFQPGIHVPGGGEPVVSAGKALLASTDPLEQARGATMLGFCPGDATIALLEPVFEKNDFSFVRGRPPCHLPGYMIRPCCPNW